MFAAIENDVLVNLIGNQKYWPTRHQTFEGVQVCGIERATGRVMGRIENEQPGTRIHGVFDTLPVHAKVRRHRHMHRAATRHRDRRIVGVITGIEHDRFIAGMNHGRDRIEDGFGGA